LQFFGDIQRPSVCPSTPHAYTACTAAYTAQRSLASPAQPSPAALNTYAPRRHARPTRAHSAFINAAHSPSQVLLRRRAEY